MRRALLCAVSSVLVAASSFAQVASEPGTEQAKQGTSRPAITEFTHPAAETRGVWLPSRDIFVPREQLMAKLDQLKEAGFNRVMINVQFRGYVLYPGSAVLPQYPECKGEDYLRLLIDACHQRGMKADAWMEYGFYAYFTADKKDPSKGKLLDADPSMMSVDKDGNGAIARPFGTFYSLDPAHPKAVDALAALNAEVAAKYDVDAVNLDRIRSAAWDHLSLAGREQFEKDTGIKWAAFEKTSAEGQRYSEWRREKNLAAAKAIVAAIRKAKPGLPVTAYVVPPDEKDDKSQAWDLWMKDDLLDAIAVSMYGADIVKDAEKAIALLGGKTDKLVAAVNSEQSTANLTTNIELSRRMKMIGQFDWFSGTIDDADVAALKAGPYARPATDPIAARK